MIFEDKGLFDTSIKSLFINPLDELFEYKKPSPISMKTLTFGVGTIEILKNVVVTTSPTTDGLVAHYPLVGNAKDTTGNYDGTEHGGLVYVDDSDRGVVASFDGDDAYILTKVPPTSSFSFSYWERRNTDSDILMAIACDNGDDSDSTYRVECNQRHALSCEFGTWNSDGDLNEIVTDLPALNEWHMITCTYDGTTKRISMDGVEKASTDVEVVVQDTAAKVEIGGRRQKNDHTYNGDISNVRIYDRALTQEEINDVYQGYVTTNVQETFYEKGIKGNTKNGFTTKEDVHRDFKNNGFTTKEDIHRDFKNNGFTTKEDIHRDFKNNDVIVKENIETFKNNDVIVKENIETFKNNDVIVKENIETFKNKLDFGYERIAYLQVPPKRMIIGTFDD